jgi:hypothetical protein
VPLEVESGGLQLFFQLQKHRNNVWGFDLLRLLKCSLTDLATLFPRTYPKPFFHENGQFLEKLQRNQNQRFFFKIWKLSKTQNLRLSNSKSFWKTGTRDFLICKLEKARTGLEVIQQNQRIKYEWCFTYIILTQTKCREK